MRNTQIYISNFSNRIVFLHCRQYLCLDRLRARIIKKANINNSRYWNSKSKDIKYAKLGFLDLYSPCLAVNYTVTEVELLHTYLHNYFNRI